jgi:hypothetical protein
MCRRCRKTTEHSIHCEEPAELVRGYKAVGNNWVNFMSSLSGSLVGILMFYFGIQFPIAKML